MVAAGFLHREFLLFRFLSALEESPGTAHVQQEGIRLISDFVVTVQLISCVRFFATPWTAACQAVSWSLLKFMSIESVMPSSHLILCHRVLLSSIFPSFKVFSSELALRIRWPISQGGGPYIQCLEFFCKELLFLLHEFICSTLYLYQRGFMGACENPFSLSRSWSHSFQAWRDCRGAFWGLSA